MKSAIKKNVLQREDKKKSDTLEGIGPFQMCRPSCNKVLSSYDSLQPFKRFSKPELADSPGSSLLCKQDPEE